MTEQNTNTSTSSSISDWLGKTIHDLEVDKHLSEQSMLRPEIEEVYNQLASEDYEGILTSSMEMAHEAFKKQYTLDLIRELIKSEEKPHRLAIDITHNTLLAWVEVESEEQEFQLYRIESRLNLKYSNKKVRMDATVVEVEDKLPIPSQYIPIISKE